ncbi:serine/threonine protein phosphatase [Planctomycetaceae bacterium SCGC AG-212-F19]|nr:serine/threonine protein phosphatase [Planctomycetaceae bacterium SCGC AG-212-F19]
MAGAPVTVAPAQPMQEVVERMNARRVGAVLVVDGTHLVGIFTERDLLRRVTAAPPGWPQRPVRDWMTPRPQTIQAQDSWEAAMALMDRLHVRHLPVLQDGKLVGILSARDLLARRAEHLNRMVELKTQELQQANKLLQDRDTELRLHMTVAGRLQTRLLPANPPSLPEIDMHAHYAPLDPLGGDYYDFVQSDARHLGILIADASGHSIPAAMVAIMTRTAFAAAARDVLRPAPVLAAINTHLHGLTGEHFVTAFYGLFHRETRKLTYANAGHPLPYRFARATGACTPLVARGTMLGIMPEADYDEHAVQLEPGDKLCFYTDGLVDAHNDAGEHYGGARLQECLRAHGAEPAGAVVAHVVDCLNAFRGNQPVKDDLTILIADVR